MTGDPDGVIEVRPSPSNLGLLAALAGWDARVPAGYSRAEQGDYLAAYAGGRAYQAGLQHGQAGRGTWTDAEFGHAMTTACPWLTDDGATACLAEYRRGTGHGTGAQS